MTRIKICGLSRSQDVVYVNRARPDWCGFVVNFPKSRRSVTPDQLRALRRELDPSVVPVGVFVDQPVEVVTDLLNRGIISIAQLHGGEDEDYTAALRAAAPGKEIWKAFPVRGPADLERAIAFPADRILLDSGQGTGRTFDWSETLSPALPAGGRAGPGEFTHSHPYPAPLWGGPVQRGGDGRFEGFYQNTGGGGRRKRGMSTCPRDDLASTAGSTSQRP